MDAEKLFVMDHPIVRHKLSILRDKNTGAKDFRELIAEMSMLICYEATRDLPLADVDIDTGLGVANAKRIAGKKLALVPVLRAGLGMVEGILRMMPSVRVGHIGMYRDPETLLPVEYYCKLPADIAERETLLLDPMLATGGTASAAVRFLKDRGVEKIKFLSILSSVAGVEKLQGDHPDVAIYTAAVDEHLNDHGYIVPGLGDAGDRIFGTQ